MENKTERQEREEWMSLDEAVERACPDRVSRALKSGEEIERNPSWYVRGDSLYGLTEARVDYEEWLDVFRDLCETPERIYDHKDKFNSEFWEERKNSGRFKSDNKTEEAGLVQATMGIQGHMKFRINYDCSDEDMREWFEEKIFEEGGYEQPEGVVNGYFGHESAEQEMRQAKENYGWWPIAWFGGKISDKDASNPSTRMEEIYLHKMGVRPDSFRDGCVSFEFDDHHFPFPKGDGYDMQRFNELERIMHKFADNPDVSSFEFNSFIVPAAPSYERDRDNLSTTERRYE